MGEDRCGSAVTVDSWEPGAFEMKSFSPSAQPAIPAPPASTTPAVALRRFRCPIAARVRVDGGVPIRISIDRRGMHGGAVTACAGPWRTSGGWWIDESGQGGKAGRAGWDRDEWDVTVSDGATYRVFRERDTDAWFVEGIVD